MIITHTNNNNSKNPFNYLLTIDMSIWSLHDGTNRRATLVTNRRMRACVTLCHSLCTAARSSVVFRGNGFIPLMRLDIYDHMFSMISISGPFVGHKRTSIAALARNPSLILAAWGEAPSCIKTTLSANTWLSMCGSTWGPRMWSVYFCAVSLRKCQLCPVCSHCWHIPLQGLPLRGRSLTSLGLTASRLKMPYTVLCGIPRLLEMAWALIPVLLRAITLQRWCIVVRGI